MGTVWLRLSTDQSSIQPFINAIFFGSAFMRYVPQRTSSPTQPPSISHNPPSDRSVIFVFVVVIIIII